MPADLKAMSEHIAVVRDALREIGESAMYDLAGQQWTECLDCGGRNGAHFPGEPDAPGSGCHVADASAAVDELARRLSELELERAVIRDHATALFRRLKASNDAKSVPAKRVSEVYGWFAPEFDRLEQVIFPETAP